MPYRRDRVRERRLALGLSQTDLARLIGTDQRTYSRYEVSKPKNPKTKRIPDADMLGKIAEALKVTTDYLVGRSPYPHIALSEGDLSPDEREALLVFRRDASEGYSLFMDKLAADLKKRGNISADETTDNT